MPKATQRLLPRPLDNLYVALVKPSSPEEISMGAIIMLGTLFGLIVVIVGLVLHFDPEARGVDTEERR